MALQCPQCGRQYDVTLFEFERSVVCACGMVLDLQRGHLCCVASEAEALGDDAGIARLIAAREGESEAITPATWDYITSSHIAEAYDSYFHYNRLFTFDTQALDRWIAEPGRLLDLGCGTGRHVVHFAERGFDVTGVDLSGHMLAVTRRKLALRQCGAMLIEGDITRLDALGLGRFAYAICMFSTLGMIYGAENRLRFLRLVRDHLEPGGLFAFHVHNRWHNLWYRDGRQYLWRALRDRVRGRSEPYQKDVDGYRGIRGLSVYVYSAREIRRVVAQAGLRVEKLLYLNHQRSGELRGLARGLRGNGFLVACRRRGGADEAPDASRR